MKMFGARARRTVGLLSLSLALALSWGGANPASAATPATGHHGTWVNLIQRNSAPLLRGWTHPGLPAGWTVHDGVLSKGGPVDDLVSTRMYKDFDLELEWNIGMEGNSGIFYRATHKYDEVYWTGPEYQLLDDQNTEDGKQ
ncbi:MAG TPA: DUF1080 domain-containing protein, partial [Acetobacteraceae bacterium]|nr:DUF1080 domain-containing protein [Acetobacteraceae bacterium]